MKFKKIRLICADSKVATGTVWIEKILKKIVQTACNTCVIKSARKHEC